MDAIHLLELATLGLSAICFFFVQRLVVDVHSARQDIANLNATTSGQIGMLHQAIKDLQATVDDLCPMRERVAKLEERFNNRYQKGKTNGGSSHD